MTVVSWAARVGAVVLLLVLASAGAVQAQTGQIERLSVSSIGEQGDAGSYGPAISGDGSVTAFVSNASNLVADDTNGRCDTFVRDAVSGATTRVSVTAAGAESRDGVQCGSTPAISDDGRYVVFVSDASDLVPGDANGQVDVFVRDRVASTTRRVSVSSAGIEADGNSFDPAISADGRFVAFFSGATNLIEGGSVSDANVYVRELATGTTELISGGPTYGVSGSSYQPSLSADGRYVAFSSQSALVEDDTNLHPDAYVVDRATRATSRVSVASDGDQGDLGSRGSEDPAISGDGRYIAFTSDARDLVAGVDRFDVQVYVRDRVAGTTTLASVNADGDEAVGDDSLVPAISADGRYVTFHTGSNNLYPGHVFDTIDVVVRDTQAATTKAITVGRAAGDYSLYASLSADGRWVAFGSLASFLVADDTNGAIDVFRRAVRGGDENPPALTLPGTISVLATSPDGAAVEYDVSAADDTDPAPSVTCTPPPGSTFAIGDSTVTCIATDAAGNRGDGSFSVHVRGASEQIDDLQHLLVVVTDIPTSLRQSLNVKLIEAETTLANGESASACDDLTAFIAQARAQSGRKLTADLAAVLIEHATRIRTVLACRSAQR
jgi:Tol biopolymer transport system component